MTSTTCHHLRCNTVAALSITRPLTELKSFSNFPFYPRRPLLKVPPLLFAKKRNSQPQPILRPEQRQEDEEEIEDTLFLDDDDEGLYDDGDFNDEYFEEEAEPSAGDGAGGGGVSLAGTGWDKRALEIAEEVALSFDGELGIYAFKTLLNATIQVRIERLTNKSGSPSMMDVEEFSKKYREQLDEAETAGSIPANISLEVSSPGLERILRIPQDLVRFKDRNMYVKYVTEVVETGSLSEFDGVFRLVSFDEEASFCTWGLADVKINREKAGKGRPLNKKQRDWRLDTPFDSLRLVRIHSEA